MAVDSLPVALATVPCALGTSAFMAAAAINSVENWLQAAQRIGAQAVYLGKNPLGQKLAAAPAPLVARRTDFRVAAVDATLGAHTPGCASSGLVPKSARAQAASLDRAEAEMAVAVTRSAVALAAELAASAVVVSLGTVHGLARLWRALRGQYRRGVLLYDDDSAREFMAVRAGLAKKHVDAALRSLDKMVEEAARRGVKILVRNPRLPAELPTAIELSVLRAEFSGAPLFPLLDLPAAHLTSTLRCISLRETVVAFADGPLACIADACGQLAGLCPGQGEVDIAAVGRALPKGAQRAFLPWPGLSPGEVKAGYHAVAAL